MDILAYILIVIALGTVTVTLIMGMVQVTKPEASARERSNILMRWRVITQAGAIGLLFIAFMILSANG